MCNVTAGKSKAVAEQNVEEDNKMKQRDDEGDTAAKQQHEIRTPATVVVVVAEEKKDETDATRGITLEEQQQQQPVDSSSFFLRTGIHKEITKQVIRCKLSKRRHLVLKSVISHAYLERLMPGLYEMFHPQHVQYNGGVAQIKNWKISCYLDVMDGGIPCTDPNVELRNHFMPVLDTCNELFLYWYRQQHSCNTNKKKNTTATTTSTLSCQRLMTFITRYTPAPGEESLLKHVDGAGKVDGSIVLSLPTDSPYEGGGLTFWDNGNKKKSGDESIHYDTRSGDVTFIDKAVWHQADPITKGKRWALVIFYKVNIE